MNSLIFYTIYWNPSDEPGKYVVRAWTFSPGSEEPIGSEEKRVATTLDEIRRYVPEDKIRTPRHPMDDPCIVETWI